VHIRRSEFVVISFPPFHLIFNLTGFITYSNLQNLNKYMDELCKSNYWLSAANNNNKTIFVNNSISNDFAE